MRLCQKTSTFAAMVIASSLYRQSFAPMPIFWSISQECTKQGHNKKRKERKKKGGFHFFLSIFSNFPFRSKKNRIKKMQSRYIIINKKDIRSALPSPLLKNKDFGSL